MPSAKEVDIQRCILENLRWRGILAFRCQPAAIPRREGGRIIGLRKGDPFNVGMPDIICVIQGRFVGIEVKFAFGRQSPEQCDWQRRIERAGAIYILARSWEDVAGNLYLK